MIFDKVKLKNGDKLKINNINYEILFVEVEAEPESHNNPPFRRFFGIYLHDNKTKSLSPTHLIKYYYDDTKEIFLKELRGKPLKEKDVKLISSKD